MDEAAFRARAQALAPGVPVRVDAQARKHGLVAGRRSYVEIEAAGPALALHHGSFREAAEAEPAFDVAAGLEGAVAYALGRFAEDGEALEAIPDDGALFETHARFRRGLAVPGGWYRRGQSLAPDVWVVDLDVFAEVVLPAHEWEALRGARLVLSLLDEELELELAEDAAPDEVWTLPDGGLFEFAPGVQEEDLEALGEDEALPGRFGDLHVVPCAF